MIDIPDEVLVDGKNTVTVIAKDRGAETFFDLSIKAEKTLPNLPEGSIGGNSKGWVALTAFGDVLDTYLGVTAYMNDAYSSGTYQCTDLAYRFLTDALHITEPKKPDGKFFAEKNGGKTGYITLDNQNYDIKLRLFRRFSLFQFFS
jgi:hypothetical protein